MSDSLGNTPTQEVQAQPLHVNQVLPAEILIQIFSHLDNASLDAINSVCQYWNALAHNNDAWREAFIQRYNGVKEFQPLSRSCLWKRELTMRERSTKQWLKATGTKHSYPLPVGGVLRVVPDFTADRLLLYQPDGGQVVVTSLRNGKHTDVIGLPGMNNGNVTSYDMTEAAIVCGTWDGHVWVKMLSNKTYMAPMVALTRVQAVPNTETGSDIPVLADAVPLVLPLVTCVHLNPDGRHTAGGFGCLSGDSVGVVKVWDLQARLMVQAISISARALLALLSDYRRHIVCLDAALGLYCIDTHTWAVTTIAQLPPLAEEPAARDIHFHVDFAGGVVAVALHHSLFLVNLNQGHVSLFLMGADAVYQSAACVSGGAYANEIIGGDGFLVSFLTVGGQVMVVNTRAAGTFDNSPNPTFTPFNVFTPVYMGPDNLPPEVPLFNAISLNPQVILLGSYNGYAATYDVFTGSWQKAVLSKFPKRLFENPMHQLFPTQHVFLNPHPKATSGISIMGRLVQYFQFGKQPLETAERGPKRRNAGMGAEKSLSFRRLITLAVREWDLDLETLSQSQQRVGKYNGTEETSEEEELKLALALSQSHNESVGENTDELDQVLAMSRVNDAPSTSDDELELAMALSLSEASLQKQEEISAAREPPLSSPAWNRKGKAVAPVAEVFHHHSALFQGATDLQTALAVSMEGARPLPRFHHRSEGSSSRAPPSPLPETPSLSDNEDAEFEQQMALAVRLSMMGA